MVYYRKYRSQTIHELDSEKLRTTLYSIFQKDTYPHAFLFTGPKGLGKTSTARIIAKVVNCEREAENRKRGEDKKELYPSSFSLHPDIEPCNTCDQCISITAGNNLDILEIDGASNRGIDEIRDLREKVKLSPSAAKKKVYIIDEVHMLTTEAFNALLKTIEEPPSHVMFIFCTTEPQKIPATILSRCFHVPLMRATQDELVRSFQRIVDSEKISIDADTLVSIAQLADGGFRDGVKMLEEIVLLANGEKITKELFENRYKVVSITSYGVRMIEGLRTKDIKTCLQLVKELDEQGADMKYFFTELLELLHGILLDKMDVSTKNEGRRRVIVLATEQKNVKGKEFSIEELQLLFALFSKAYQEIKYAVLPQLPIELAIITYVSNTQSSQNSPDEIKSSPVMQNKLTMATLLKKQHALRIKSILQGDTMKVADKTSVITDVLQANLSENTDEKKSLLENVIYNVKTYNHSVAAVLRGCTIRTVDDGAIVFETSYAFHKERLSDGKSMALLEKTIKQLTGKQLNVSIELKK